jgi:hypothetical protein
MRDQRSRRLTPPGARTLLCCLAAFMALPAAAAEPLFRLQDARGDDDGNGSLIYPNRDDLHRGDLDLVSFAAEQREDGVWFTAELGQAIRSPVGRVTEMGQTPMERIARNGFYTFNIDIYVDTDRIAGSGQTGTVPGRNVAVDRQFAWERAIVLTPRPDIARTMLQMHFDEQYEAELRAKQGKVSKDELRDLQERAGARVDELFYFPNKVRVNGRKVEFLVPQEFFGAAPSKSWGYTVMVTGADLEQTGRPSQLSSIRTTMMTMGVGRGITGSLWGIRSDADEATPPIIDILAPDAQTQHGVLSDYDAVAGRLPAVPGIAPDGTVAMASNGEPVAPGQLAGLEPVAVGGDAAGGSARPASTERRTVPARLRTLNELLANGLITQAEYNELRRKILAEL